MWNVNGTNKKKSEYFKSLISRKIKKNESLKINSATNNQKVEKINFSSHTIKKVSQKK